MKTIVALGPNPAWQKTLFFDRFTPGEINRAREMSLIAAGKGINFCRAAGIHGRARARLIQFSGGDTGRYIRHELEREGIESWSVETSASTRTCTTCLDLSNQSMTEVIEPSFPATAEEVETMLEYLEKALREGAAAAALCGTLPTGTDPMLYPRAAALAKKAGTPILVDSFRDIGKVLDSGAEIWFKINRDELRAMTGKGEVAEGLAAVFAAGSVRYAAITDGPGRAYASDGKRLAVYSLPKLEKIVNPLGSGDTASAVWASELLAGSDPFEGFRPALAAASANCLSASSGSYEPEDAQRIAREIGLQFL